MGPSIDFSYVCLWLQARDALRMVRSEGLNLVQVSLRTGIPLCKGLDFRQYLLNQKIGPEIVEKTKATNVSKGSHPFECMVSI
mmetsp:Transcript_7727/g.34278  ORF Transcript_7727/g.34278 Transcript_7727/m.34278 type:complete len:83 (+) Transcript_7727:1067-1315(+)